MRAKRFVVVYRSTRSADRKCGRIRYDRNYFERRRPGTHPGTDEPSINSPAEAANFNAGGYLGFDGGDFLTYDTTNEAWMQTLHKDNAIVSVVIWVYLGATGINQRLIGTADATADIGWRVGINTVNALNFNAFNGSATIINVNSGL